VFQKVPAATLDQKYTGERGNLPGDETSHHFSLTCLLLISGLEAFCVRTLYGARPPSDLLRPL
jgi:hypothetical protein